MIGSAIAGAVLGGAICNQASNGDDGATWTGVIIGAIVGAVSFTAVVFVVIIGTILAATGVLNGLLGGGR